ncbi:MAG: hypothetical protein ABIU54_01550 [Candidatus Eisenbacteria bacterium]
MSDPTFMQRLNRLAIVLALVLLAALGGWWWREHSKLRDTPRWEPARFVRLLAPDAVAPSEAERWVVAVNLKCPHCQAHLAWLRERIAARPAPPLLGALIVDQPTRPESLALGALGAGVYWDSAQVWREVWGRGMYGETMRFDRHGQLLSASPGGMVPDSLTL